MEFKQAIADEKVEMVHAVFQREQTKIPLQNREIHTLRKEVAAIIKKKLGAAAQARLDPEYEQAPDALAKELKEAIDLANKQNSHFPYATEVLTLRAYKECLEALSNLEPEQDSNAGDRDDVRRMNKSVSFGNETDGDGDDAF